MDLTRRLFAVKPGTLQLNRKALRTITNNVPTVFCGKPGSATAWMDFVQTLLVTANVRLRYRWHVLQRWVQRRRSEIRARRFRRVVFAVLCLQRTLRARRARRQAGMHAVVRAVCFVGKLRRRLQARRVLRMKAALQAVRFVVRLGNAARRRRAWLPAVHMVRRFILVRRWMRKLALMRQARRQISYTLLIVGRALPVMIEAGVLMTAYLDKQVDPILKRCKNAFKPVLEKIKAGMKEATGLFTGSFHALPFKYDPMAEQLNAIAVRAMNGEWSNWAMDNKKQLNVKADFIVMLKRAETFLFQCSGMWATLVFCLVYLLDNMKVARQKWQALNPEYFGGTPGRITNDIIVRSVFLVKILNATVPRWYIPKVSTDEADHLVRVLLSHFPLREHEFICKVCLKLHHAHKMTTNGRVNIICDKCLDADADTAAHQPNVIMTLKYIFDHLVNVGQLPDNPTDVSFSVSIARKNPQPVTADSSSWIPKHIITK